MINNQHGFGLIETLAASVILTIVIIVASQGQIFIAKEMNRSSRYNQRKQLTTNMLKVIRGNPKLFQAHFVNYSPMQEDNLLKVETAPLAWNEEGVFDASVCSECPGRISFFIERSDVVIGAFTLHLTIFELRNKGRDEWAKRTFKMVFGH